MYSWLCVCYFRKFQTYLNALKALVKIAVQWLKWRSHGESVCDAVKEAALLLKVAERQLKLMRNEMCV